MKRSTCTHVIGFSRLAYRRLDRIAAALERLAPEPPAPAPMYEPSLPQTYRAMAALAAAGVRSRRPLDETTRHWYVEAVERAIHAAIREYRGLPPSGPEGS